MSSVIGRAEKAGSLSTQYLTLCCENQHQETVQVEDPSSFVHRSRGLTHFHFETQVVSHQNWNHVDRGLRDL